MDAFIALDRGDPTSARLDWGPGFVGANPLEPKHLGHSKWILGSITTTWGPSDYNKVCLLTLFLLAGQVALVDLCGVLGIIFLLKDESIPDKVQSSWNSVTDKNGMVQFFVHGSFNTIEWDSTGGRHSSPHHDRSSAMLHGRDNAIFRIALCSTSTDENATFVAKQYEFTFVSPKNTTPLSGSPV